MKFYTGQRITNNFNKKDDPAVEAMKAPKTSDKVVPIHEATKQHFAQKDEGSKNVNSNSDPAVNAMKTPSTASMVTR